MKNNFTFLFLAFLCLSSLLTAQNQFEQATSIRADGLDPDASAMLDVQSSTQGMLVPRMTTTQRDMITSPATGLLVFDTDTGGFWFFDGAAWVDLSAPRLLADADGDTQIQVEETTDEDKIRMDIEGTERVVIRKNNSTGDNAMIEVFDDDNNLYVGKSAGESNLSGIQNTFVGTYAGFNHESGQDNTFLGNSAGNSLETGSSNTFVGGFVGTFQTSGNYNTYLGSGAGSSASGSNNVFLGAFAGKNETGSNRLYIQNSDAEADSALIYGEFDNDSLRINGDLSVRNGFQLPTGAAANYVLKSDAQGNSSWQPLLNSFSLTPALCADVNAGPNPLGLFVLGDYAYTVDNVADDLKVFDISDPENPTFEGDIDFPSGSASNPRKVVAQGDYAYVIDQNADNLRVINVSNPVSPSLSGTLGIGGNPTMLGVSGNHVYITDNDSDDLRVINVSDPANPAQIASLGLGTDPRFLAIQGTYVYVIDADANDLKIIDISDPANPALSGSLTLGSSPRQMFVKDDIAYITSDAPDNLYTVDVSNPASPALKGTLGLGTNPVWVYVQGNYAYVIDNDVNDLKVIDVSSPTNPFITNSLNVGTAPRQIQVQGNYAFITDSDLTDLQVYRLGEAMVSLNANGELTPYNINWRNNGDDIFNDNKGNVGIGTNTPGFNLEVNGTLAADSALIGNIAFSDQSVDQETSNHAGDGFLATPWIYSNAIEAQSERGVNSTLITVGDDGTYGIDDEIHFVTNGTDRMAVMSNGDIVIGDEILADLGSDNLGIDADVIPSVAGGGVWDIGNNVADQSWDDVVGDDFINVSDRRKKRDIKTLEYGLAEILQLRPVTYQYLHEPDFAPHSPGLIAQEVLPIIPEVVKTHEIDADENGVLQQTPVDFYGINYVELVPLLIKGMQEQQVLIEEMKERMTEMEALIKD